MGASAKAAKTDRKPSAKSDRPKRTKTAARSQECDGDIKIDKGLEMPTRRKKYPFEKLEVGDSFLAVTSEKSAKTKTAGGFVYTYASIAGKKLRETRNDSTKFTVSKQGDDFRVWRVS